MAKIAFNKLGLKINQEIKTIEFNGQNIEIKQYLPVQEKLQLLSQVIMKSYEEDKNYLNPLKIKIITELEIVYAYTNINFTDKQKEDIAKTYDLLKSSELMDVILQSIPEKDKDDIFKASVDTAEAIYKYQTSILGIMDNLKDNYKDLPENMNIEEMQKEVEALSNSPMLKGLLGLQ